MSTKLEQAARQALEALIVAEEFVDRHSEDWYISGQQDLKQIRESITALREALAEQEKPLYRKVLREMLDAHEQSEQEPVAYLRMGSDQRFVVTKAAEELVADTFHQLYTAPVRTKDLTDDELDIFVSEKTMDMRMTLREFARAVIAADREKNK